MGVQGFTPQRMEKNIVKKDIVFLDCTLRDGGYYNNWDFSVELINSYLSAVSAAGVNVVEIGFRSLKNDGFKGACAYSTDEFLETLKIPSDLKISVMVNAGEFLHNGLVQFDILEKLFPKPVESTPVKIVRIACHIHEFVATLPVCIWFKERGFYIIFNLMQIADRNQKEVEEIAFEAAKRQLDVLYFADSMGSMTPEHTLRIVSWLRKHWTGALGLHTHDNMELALQNSLHAMAKEISWVDATVTGIGRGPGNAKTELIAVAIAQHRSASLNIVPLMRIIRLYFEPMKKTYGWGTNIYYYLAGKYAIHPTYIQEMIGDSRYSEEDLFAVIEQLRIGGGKKFCLNTLDAARNFYHGEVRGTWIPASLIKDREVLLIGTGPSSADHAGAIEAYIRRVKPFVLALNTQSQIDAELIDMRVACHPVRLLADCKAHIQLPQPLITPASMLPENVKLALEDKILFDFGLEVQADTFKFEEKHCIIPRLLVFAYALAVATSGRTNRIVLAGFDGYGADDPRTTEMQKVIDTYKRTREKLELFSITPTRYVLPKKSVYAL